VTKLNGPDPMVALRALRENDWSDILGEGRLPKRDNRIDRQKQQNET
jgi:hypothetical protein